MAEIEIVCPNCGSKNTLPEICGECGGNGDTGAPLELMCEECGGTGITELYECDECGELFA